MGRSLTTDGHTLFSYMLPIAERSESNGSIRVLLDRFVSVTTSRHLGIAVATAKHEGLKVEWPRKSLANEAKDKETLQCPN